MTGMISALVAANNFADSMKLFEVQLKSNGYPMDGHRPTSPSERIEIVTKLAEKINDDESRTFLMQVSAVLYEALTLASQEELRERVKVLRKMIDERIEEYDQDV